LKIAPVEGMVCYVTRNVQNKIPGKKSQISMTSAHPTDRLKIPAHRMTFPKASASPPPRVCSQVLRQFFTMPPRFNLNAKVLPFYPKVIRIIR
jgi:hypothetical protein